MAFGRQILWTNEDGAEDDEINADYSFERHLSIITSRRTEAPKASPLCAPPMLMKISKVVVVLLLLGLALIGMLLFVVPGRDLLDKQRFYSMARKKEAFLLTELFPSKRQCVLPARIGVWMLPDIQKGDDEGDLATTWADSDHDWFIVLFQNADPNLRVIAISETKVPLANTVELANFNKICGENLKVSFDQDGRAVFSQ